MLYLNDRVRDMPPDALPRALAQLPPWRRAEALRHRRPLDQLLSALAYLELLRGLRLEYGISRPPRFERGELGKPSLEGLPHIHFSLSHCDEAAGCLLSTRPCGLDVERARPFSPDLLRHTMSEAERLRIEADPWPDLAAAALWTRKEALLKMRGTGLRGRLPDTLSPANLRGARLRTTVNAARGYALTVSTSAVSG